MNRAWLAAVLTALMSGVASAQEPAFQALDSQLSSLNSQIKTRGARWSAGVTSVSGLSDEEMKSRVGTQGADKQLANPRDEMRPLAALPASLDWRTHNGGFVSAVKDQAKCGSCWAFAMTGALESNVMLLRRQGGDVDLSEQVMVSCSGTGSCNGGRLNAKFLEKTGLPPESYYPYTATGGQCSRAAAGWKQAAHKIGDWRHVWPSVASVKAALAAYGPLPTTLMVWEDFKHYKSGVYSYTSGKILGGHAVLLVGYNDDEKYFVVKNSWGPGWGEDGYFRIDYSEMRSRVLFGLQTIAYESPGRSKFAGLEAGSSVAEEVSPKIEPVLRQKP